MYDLNKVGFEIILYKKIENLHRFILKDIHDEYEEVYRDQQVFISVDIPTEKWKN
ncbi:hypothetical protein [Virgibacillus ainsalahensis]